jgi:hypothetical protein
MKGIPKLRVAIQTSTFLEGLRTAKIIIFPTFSVQQCNIIQENIKLKKVY